MLDKFDNLVHYVDCKIKAFCENIMAKELLESLRFIPMLRKLFNILKQNVNPVPDIETDLLSTFACDKRGLALQPLGKEIFNGTSSTLEKMNKDV